MPSGGGAGASSVPARPPTSLADINVSNYKNSLFAFHNFAETLLRAFTLGTVLFCQYLLSFSVFAFHTPFFRADQGAHVRTLEISTKEKNRGLAISPDGTRLVVSNELVHNVRVYALPGGASLKVFGGEGSAPGQFRNPQKMCFAPNDNARVFIVDRWNKRVQVRVSAACCSSFCNHTRRAAAGNDACGRAREDDW